MSDGQRTIAAILFGVAWLMMTALCVYCLVRWHRTLDKYGELLRENRRLRERMVEPCSECGVRIAQRDSDGLWVELGDILHTCKGRP